MKRLFVYIFIAASLLIGTYFYIIAPHKIAVIQGYTDSQNTNFVVITHQKETICEVYEKDSQALISSSREEDIIYKDPKKIVHQCDFQNLAPNKKYQLLIKKDSQVLARRYFHLLDTEKDFFSVALESCTSDIVHLPLLWDNLKSHKPDYLFMLGDNVYGDLFKDYAEITEEHLWDRYFRSLRVFKIFQQEELTPVLAIWDDHDYGKNNSDSSYEKKDFTLFLFRTFFNQNKNTPVIKQGPGTSFVFSVKKHHFVFLDVRSFRSPNSMREGTYFSDEQVKWVKEQFSRNPTDSFWLISGSQWFGTADQDESFEVNHPENAYKFITDIDIAKYDVQLISGDSHFSEFKKIPLPEKAIYEITSSAMHALPMGKISPDARRLSATNLPNFLIGKISLKEPRPHTFSSYSLFNIKMFEHLIP